MVICGPITQWINKYIHCHLQTYCFVVSQLFSVAKHVRRLKPGSKPYLRSTTKSNKRTTLAKGFIRYYVATAAAASVCLHFYTLSATRVLNSFEELYIMRVAAENSFARVLNSHGWTYIHIYIYIYMDITDIYIYI